MSERDHPRGRHRWIGVRWERSNVIEQRAVVVRSVVATMVRIAAAAVVAAWVVLAAEAVSEAEAEAFEEVVAGADGTMGRFRAEVTFPTRRPQAQQWGGVRHEPGTHETAARAFRTVATLCELGVKRLLIRFATRC